MSDELLSKILSGTASEEEKRAYYEKVAKDESFQEEFYQTKSLWVRATADRKDSNINLDEEYRSLRDKVNGVPKAGIRNLTRIWIGRAAMIVVLFSVGWLAHQLLLPKPQMDFTQKFASSIGSISQMTLPDGTQIWLNSGSEVVYHENSTERSVQLVGEACFDVAHDEKHPFYVRTGNMIVRDLGTRFNVRAYPDDDVTETTLIEGSAEILSVNMQRVCELKPGHLAVYDKEKKQMSLQEIDPSTIVAWMDGKFVFRNEKLVDICDELGKWYGVRFRFGDDVIEDYRYTANIKRTTSISYVLKMLNITTHLNYSIKENKMEPDIITISTEKKN
ncbi:anti-sigma factor [Prolixibacter bellariivorans]|uniref:Anti-sigma factor n=1 Tax=Prolixibacter bellariivorans TaxID=314319 RepID=A0A5M4B581_9BACT|nr:FecR domain-containing protein [Prolixibacter bellariivorans]GET34998.1 anti-sigma factor [Prolixibacter bellariivorans]